MKDRSIVIKKSPLMMLVCFFIWGAIILRYNRLLYPLLNTVDSIGAKALVVFAISWINLVWFYGVFHFVNVLFSVLSKPIPFSHKSREQIFPRVAVLYTICNDFCLEAVESCVNQDYPNFKVYVLDDSTDLNEQHEVEAFCGRYPDNCVLVRRNNRHGFKAGNLNHALRTVANDYQYFAVIDADEIVLRNFLSRTVPRFNLDERIGFVQGNHRYRKTKTNSFATIMSRDAELHWDLFLPARNKYGFVLFYGHGAVVRTDVWRKVGGFPEVVSEDIAFTTKAREHGFYGIFLRDVVAEEAFPSDYFSFFRRELKVVKGTLQFLFGPARSFLRSRNVTVTEKIDLLASALILFLPVFFLGYLVVANVILPLAIASHSASTSTPWANNLRGWLQNLEPLGAEIQKLWSWDFYLLTILTILAPLFYQVKVLICSPGRMFLYAARSTVVFLSVIPSIAWDAISYIVRRRAEFVPTGDRTTKNRIPGNGRWIFSVSIGIILFLFSLLTGNVALLTIAFSFLLHPLLLKVRSNSLVLKVLTFVPFIFFIAVFGSIPFLIVGVAGAFAATVPAHH